MYFTVAAVLRTTLRFFIFLHDAGTRVMNTYRKQLYFHPASCRSPYLCRGDPFSGRRADAGLRTIPLRKPGGFDFVSYMTAGLLASGQTENSRHAKSDKNGDNEYYQWVIITSNVFWGIPTYRLTSLPLCHEKRLAHITYARFRVYYLFLFKNSKDKSQNLWFVFWEI